MPLKRLLRMVPPELRLATALAGLLVGLLFLEQSLTPVHAAGPRYVALNGADSGDCRSRNAPCATPQYAVDVAASGDEIRLAAGTYTDIHLRAGITQTVYLSKTVTIRGGYTTANWDSPDPVAHPTTLDAQGRGRVFYISGQISPTIEGLRLTNGDATAVKDTEPGYSNGGAMFSITATVTLHDNWIARSRAVYGGGVYALYSVVRMHGNTIAENSSEPARSGGGVRLFSSTALLEDNRIISNTAQYIAAPGPAPSTGGGLSIGGSHVTLVDNTISSNTAFSAGGGMVVANSVLTMTGNLIADNVVKSRTGSGGGMMFSGSSGVVSDNAITGNVSFGAGGGVFLLVTPHLLIQRNVISNNVATSGGGACLSSSNNLLDSNLVTHNHGVDGGGFCFNFSSPTLINTIIADNTADNGSGVSGLIGAPRFIHTTIARNTTNNGSGGNGIYMSTGNGYYTASLTLINSIVIDHTVGVSTTTGVTTTLNGILWFGNNTNISSAGSTTITNAVTGNPAFTADGYHLTTCSAARGRGVNAGVSTDIDGDPRPTTAIDLGADQFVLVGATCSKVYLPVVEHTAGTISLHETAIAVLTRIVQNRECSPYVDARYFHYSITCGGPAGHGFSIRMTYFPSEVNAVRTFNTMRGDRPMLDFHGYAAYTDTYTAESQIYIQGHTWLAHSWIIAARTSDSSIGRQNPQYISDDVYRSAQYLQLFLLKAYQTFLPVVYR